MFLSAFPGSINSNACESEKKLTHMLFSYFGSLIEVVRVESGIKTKELLRFLEQRFDKRCLKNIISLVCKNGGNDMENWGKM